MTEQDNNNSDSNSNSNSNNLHDRVYLCYKYNSFYTQIVLGKKREQIYINCNLDIQ
jgi:hypothetical protein